MRGTQPEPHLFIIFGATGDLSRRKLLPAFYRLFARGALPERSLVLGVARDTELGDEGFRALAEEALQNAGVPAEEIERWCTERLFYQTIGEAEASDFAAIAERVAELEREYDLPGNRAFYLALPPSVFPDTLSRLGEAGLNESAGWTRLVVEKPFGHDLESARELNRLVHSCFSESQVYRIDHYLGKETVQNLLVFRFANPIFESLWNRDRIESVRILVAEEDGIGSRAGYYEHAGALRDMVQNHLTQLLTLVAMDVPGEFSAENIRYEKVKVLRAVSPPTPEDVVFGQYTRAQMNGTEAAGYQEEHGVREGSTTPTFAALRLQVNNWRWQGVPFFLVTGKRMPERLTRITVVFQRAPVSLFRPFPSCSLHRNVLEFTLQPDEGFALSFEMKTPGQPLDLATQRLDFDYAEAFEPLAEAYETLLLDVLNGDQTLFVHADEVEASWGLYTPLLEQEIPISPYPAGSWGPEVVERLRAGGFAPVRPAR
ncbi:MAG: glucose-6-phosphate dehydrogenase [Gemmatimonadetes bacterium]|nr:glucose-6-phosphate dehydrogenase [Gemmatimonadota bacterium]